MTSLYPTRIDPVPNDADEVVVAVQEVLGTMPQGNFPTVRARLESIEAHVGPSVTVTDYDSVQAAISDAHNQGGKIVFFPPGVYEIGSSGLYALDVYDDTPLVGYNRRFVEIRLADGQSNYITMLACEGASAQGRIFLSGITFNQNTQGNPYTADSLGWTGDDFLHPRYVVMLNNVVDFAVEQCNFIGLGNINTLMLTGVANTGVRDCGFDYDVPPFHHDCSAVYLHPTAGHGRIQSCWFHGQLPLAPWQGGNFTAIETHGSHVWVESNEISGFARGMNITGASLRSEDIIVRSNIITGVNSGIMLYALPYKENDQQGLRNVQIVQNSITLDNGAWWPVRNRDGTGICTYRYSSLPIENLVIAGNIVRVANTTGMQGAPSEFADWCGIGALHDTALDRNWSVVNNIVDGAIGPAFAFRNDIDGFVKHGNPVVREWLSNGFG